MSGFFMTSSLGFFLTKLLLYEKVNNFDSIESDLFLKLWSTESQEYNL